jgi:hypothetical protein
VTPIRGATPEKPNGTSLVSLASTSQSVYAVAARRIEGDQRPPTDPGCSADAPNNPTRSVYDASVGGATLRR